VLVVQIPLDVGRLPATICSPCSSCGRAFAAWTHLNNLPVRVLLDAKPPLAIAVTSESFEYAALLLDLFRSWAAVAVASDGEDDHLEALGAEA